MAPSTRLFCSLVFALGQLALWLAPHPAHALSMRIQFACVGGPGSDPEICGIGETQLGGASSTDGLAANQLLFTFTNSGDLASSITDVYFESEAELGAVTILDDPPQVEFALQKAGGNLPGAEDLEPAFSATLQFSVPSNRPHVRGVDRASESLGLLFDLQPGVDVTDVWPLLTSGSLRVGVVTRGFSSGGTGSFVGQFVIPEPTTLGLLAAGLAALAALGRKRSD